MKKLFSLGVALLSLYACSPSSNPIPEDSYTPNPNPGENPKPNNDPTIENKNYNFNASDLFAAPRKGGLVEISVEFEGDYTITSDAYFIQVVRTKAMQQGTVAVSLGANLGQSDRSGVLTIRYVSKETTTTQPNGSAQSVKTYAEKKVKITQQPVAKEVLLADITQAQSLYVAAVSDVPSGVASKAGSLTQKLYKIASTGAVDSVVFKDEYGDTATVAINYIRNLSDKYVFMSLRVEPRNDYKYYVVRKTDGAVFAAKPPYIEKDTEVQTDHRQNIYYAQSYPRMLYKMYDYNSGVDIAQLNKDYMSVDSYRVDPKGNVLLGFRNTISGSSENLCYTSSGEWAKSKWAFIYFTGSDSPFVLKKETENFYRLKGEGEGYREATKLFRLRSTLPETTSEVVGELKYNGQQCYFYVYYDFRKHSFTLEDMSVFIGEVGAVGQPSNLQSAILRIENEKNYSIVAMSRDLPKYNKSLQVANGYIYGYNNDEIFRIGIATGQVETLYANREYSIYDFSLNADGVMTFSALELRKAQDVVCELRNGVLKVLKTDDSQKIIQLERIN